MNEIVTDIFTWAWFSEPHGYSFNGHLVRHGERNLCIDPVQPSEEGIADIARIGAAKILLTNRNHSRAAHVIRAHRRPDPHSPGRRGPCPKPRG